MRELIRCLSSQALRVGVLALATSLAQAADVQGGHDHPLITRFAASTLVGYYHSDWEQTSFPLSTEMSHEENTRFAKPVPVEGAVTRLVYLAPRGKSTLEVFRNYQQALMGAGLKPVFGCEGNCGTVCFHWQFGAVRNAMKYTKDVLRSATREGATWNMEDAIASDQGRLLYGTMNSGGRTLHVALYTSVAGYTETGQAATLIEIAEPKAMQGGQVTVDAAAMSKGLAAEGKVALYGVYFDFGKAELKPESDAQLKEMAKLLAGTPELNVFIVGHTDNQGAFESNVKLSLQRAAAVRDALVGRFKVAPSRLTPYGVASVSPVAANATDEGRARNRRVELVTR